MTLKECMSIVAGMKWADDAVCVFTFNNRYPFERMKVLYSESRSAQVRVSGSEVLESCSRRLFSLSTSAALMMMYSTIDGTSTFPIL